MNHQRWWLSFLKFMLGLVAASVLVKKMDRASETLLDSAIRIM